MKKLFALVLALLILVMPVCVLAGNGDNVNVPFDPVGGHGTLIETDNNEVNTAFIEPNYYPDYDVAPAPMPARNGRKSLCSNVSYGRLSMATPVCVSALFP